MCWLLATLALVAVWAPVVRHYRLADVEISDAMVSAARESPPDDVLRELAGYRFFGGDRDGARLVRTADTLLTGELDYPGYPRQRITLPFDAADLERGPALFLASFGVPDLLLGAYEASGRNEFLTTARDVIVKWAEYEEAAWRPRGLLWNDHAVAERILVLARFWRHYRQHPHYEHETARRVLRLAARTARLLGDPRHFTFSTNHGVMQNLALWHFSLAFPRLPEVRVYKELALQRLREQMRFYVDDQGVVLEHSPAYQRAGVEFLGMAMRYLTLLDTPVPQDWVTKYRNAIDYYGQLRRPNGSLPVLGDTGRQDDEEGPRLVSTSPDGRASELTRRGAWPPPRPVSLYPVAGYAIWWGGLGTWPDARHLAQTVVAWSHFPRHAHKHADEMSVSVWAGGETWWTNLGYWPYGAPGRGDAVSWDGSNAPHFTHERWSPAQTTVLMSHERSRDLAFIDLARTGQCDCSVRRQVLHVEPDVWVVLDHTRAGASLRSRTIWRTSPQIRMRALNGPGSVRLQAKDGGLTLTAHFAGSSGGPIQLSEAGQRSFAGSNLKEPGPSVVVEQPAADSWSVAAWSIDRPGQPGSSVGKTEMLQWQDVERWKIAVQRGSRQIVVQRDGRTLTVGDGVHDRPALELRAASDFSQQYGVIRRAFMETAARYPTFPEYAGYRRRLTTWLVIAFAVQEAFFLVYRRPGPLRARLRIAACALWVVVFLAALYLGPLLQRVGERS